MNPARFQAGAYWAARIAAFLIWLASVYLIGVLLAFIWTLAGANHDLPPTWYYALTLLLVVADVAAICFITFKAMPVLFRKAPLARLARVAAVLVLLLGALHQATAHAYSLIPQWDFQDSLFDDLSWRREPGRISQECAAETTQGTRQGDNASPSPEPGGERPTSFEDIQRIAGIGDWRKLAVELENRTVVGWRGWIRDVSRHGYYSNPEHRLVTLYLIDPYSGGSVSPDDPPGGSIERAEVVLSYFDSLDISKLSVGQEVLLCGRIADVSTPNYGDIYISINRPVLNPLPLPEALTTTQVPADFALEYKAHGCGEGFDCDEYELRIDADGNITYEGIENVQTTGTRTDRMPRDRLKQLVFELQRTKFFSIDNLPEKLEGNPKGSTVIRATMAGRSKTVVLPWKGVSWPASVIMVIGKVEEVSNLPQWVNLVKSP